MHDITILGISAQDIRDDLAESLREDSLVNVLNSGVHVFFGGTHATHHISVVHIYFSFPFQNSHEANACKSNISSPFLTSAPRSAPLRMKRV